jgi:hypothetical protein
MTQTMTETPDHLFPCHDGALYDTRSPDWSRNPPLRPIWSTLAPPNVWRSPRTRAAAFKAALRHGLYIWPGGYDVHLLMRDGGILCHDCTRKEARRVLSACVDGLSGWADTAWLPSGLAPLWEGPDESCAHCSAPIPTIYGDPDAEE